MHYVWLKNDRIQLNHSNSIRPPNSVLLVKSTESISRNDILFQVLTYFECLFGNFSQKQITRFFDETSGYHKTFITNALLPSVLGRVREGVLLTSKYDNNILVKARLEIERYLG